MTWTTTTTQPGAYLWRLREGEPIVIVKVWLQGAKLHYNEAHQYPHGFEVGGSGEFLPITAILDACERIADLERVGETKVRPVFPVPDDELDDAASPKPASGLWALVTQWRETAGTANFRERFWANGILKCADELEAVLRAMQEHDKPTIDDIHDSLSLNGMGGK